MKINLRKQAGKGDDNTVKNLFKVGLCGVWSLVDLSLNHCQGKFGIIMGWGGGEHAHGSP